MTKKEERGAVEDAGRLSTLVPEAFELADQIAREGIEREAKLGSKVSCAKGCAACCRWLVCVSIPEALYIHERLRTCECRRRDEVFHRFLRIKETLEENGLAEALATELTRGQSDLTFDHRLHLLSRRYHALQIPCPFLEKDACSIYSWRPTKCRQYYVTSPPHWCVDPFKKNVRRLSLGHSVPDLLAEIAADLLGEPRRLIALPLVLDWALEHNHLTGLKWPRQQLLARLG
ncbi:MAG: hypothetical protein SWE60_02910 [Thermodesulfobacteriota bacterium]|nr:hypothetical protein [Thermodesulfobacteriota bacterium]